MDPQALYVAGFGAGTTLGMLLILRGIVALIDRSKSEKSNAAWRLVQAGDVLAVFLVATSVVKNCVTGESLQHDIMMASGFGLLGLALVQLTGRLSLMALLHSRLVAELDRGNVAAGVAASSHFVAAGLIAAPAMNGTDFSGLGLGMTFFVIAQVTHFVFITLFRALTTYDDAEQIQGDNVAAAISYAGLSIAIAVLVARAVQGDFTGWASSLAGFGLMALLALALYPVRQLLVQGLFLGGKASIRGGSLDAAIAEQRSSGMAALEAATYIASAFAIAGLV